MKRFLLSLFILFIIFINTKATAETNTKYTFTHSDIELTELYKYPKYGFYIFQSNQDALEIVDYLSSTFSYDSKNWLRIYIFNHKPNLTKVKNATKETPANMIIETEKLFPYIKYSSIKNYGNTLCYNNPLTNQFDFYVINEFTNWNWQHNLNSNACNTL